MNRLMQIFATLLIAAVTFATLGPPSERPHLRSLGQDGEHALAFIAVGLAVGFAWPRRPRTTAAVGVFLTAALELAQLLMPGRHARWNDFLVDAGTLCIGLAVAALAYASINRLKTLSAV